MFMMYTILFLSSVVGAIAIKVPVDGTSEDQQSEVITVKSESNNKNPIFYEQSEGIIDSYLIPPNTHTQDEHFSDTLPLNGDVVTPATYLLPPLPDIPDYFVPNQPVQTDWYPIIQALPKPNSKLIAKPKAIRFPKKTSILSNVAISTFKPDDSNVELPLTIPIPSRQLEPPSDTPADYAVSSPAPDLQLPLSDDIKQDFIIASPSTELELPLETNPNFSPKLTNEIPLNFHLKPAHPTLSLHLTPPEVPIFYPYKNPTKLYPKKYTGYKSVPIPLPYTDDTFQGIQKLKKAKLHNPILNLDDELFISDDKTNYQFEQAEQKRKLKDQEEAIKQQESLDPRVEEVAEQDASETGFRLPGRNRYPIPPRQAPLRYPPQPPRPTEAAESNDKAEQLAPPAGDRTEFRMHGMNGPHSYQFGYDTGKGKNRQFRYEERDNEGHVRGHYGYVDKRGKMRVVKYDAHPEHGFHSDAVPEPAAVS